MKVDSVRIMEHSLTCFLSGHNLIPTFKNLYEFIDSI